MVGLEALEVFRAQSRAVGTNTVAGRVGAGE